MGSFGCGFGDGGWFRFLSPSSPVQSLYRQQQPLRLRHRRLPSSAIRLLNEKIMKCWEAGGTDSRRRGRVQEWMGGRKESRMNSDERGREQPQLGGKKSSNTEFWTNLRGLPEFQVP